MYGDIIPPKKKYTKAYTEEYDSVRFTHLQKKQTQSKSIKIPLVLFLIAIISVAAVIYHKVYGGTGFTITPKTSRFEIHQKVPLILQSRDKDALTYELVYVPQSGSFARNPFAGIATTTTISTTSIITITATSTGDVKVVSIINKTATAIPLRKDTRFDVKGVTYTLDTQVSIDPTKDSTSTEIYKVIGFIGGSMENLIYAISDKNNQPSTGTSTSISTATLPPKDVLSLIPEGTIALQKSTIYDKLLDQSAIVVLDQKTFEDFLNTKNIQLQEYYNALKPFGESISYNINIIDYTLETSPDSGKPVSFSSLILEITPKFNNKTIALQFAGFSKDTMNKIQKQVKEYLDFSISYTPFWRSSVAEVDKIRVDVRDAK